MFNSEIYDVLAKILNSHMILRVISEEQNMCT